MGPFTLITTTAEVSLVDVPNWIWGVVSVLLVAAGLCLLSEARGWFSWAGPWTALALVLVAVWVCALSVGLADRTTERTIDRVVQAEGTVASVEDTDGGVEVTLEEDDSRVLRFDVEDSGEQLPGRGDSLTATCTDLDDPQALASCSEGPVPELDEVAGDVSRTAERYTD